MEFSIILFILTFLAVMLVSGNNLSACIGPAVGSRILSKKAGILLGATGFSLGLLTQGSTMIKSVEILLPSASSQLRSEALLVAIIIFTIAYIIRIPISLGMSLVGLLSGLSIGTNNPFNIFFASGVILMWIITPIIGLFLAGYITKSFNQDWPKNYWHRIQTYKILLILLAFSSSFVLGANTIGLIIATGGFKIITIIGGIAAIFIGAFYLSEGGIKRISQELFLMRYPNATASLITTTILVEVATLFNIPLSNTQTVTAAILGTGISYKTKLVSLKPFLMIILGWIIAPLLSFIIGLLL